MTATLITVGDEILIGQIVNTNAAWLGERLGLEGISLRRSVSVPDRIADILDELHEAWGASDLVLLTGGLGPTHDDLTREALAAYFEAPLVHHAPTMARIEARFAARGRPMPARNRVQALVPEGFDVLDNDHGTAPGLYVTRSGKHLAALPGVPIEMKHLVEERLLPRLGRDGRVIRHRTLLTAGVGESSLADEIGDLSPWLDERTRLAFLPSMGTVRLRVTAEGDDVAEVEARAERFVAHLRARAGRALVGEAPITLEGALGDLLRARGDTLAVAESCTSGHLLDRLTDVPGASEYVLGGIVAYCNFVKTAVLGVHERMLIEEGAVSEAVARRMAEGVRVRMGATYALSTTGVAGPGGGTPDKPVGTVWIGLAGPDGSFARRFQFGPDRRTNKQLAATTAIDLLRRLLAREKVRGPRAGVREEAS
jgi:nicotinamide-nucleotide amidase